MMYKWGYEWFKSFRQVLIILLGETLSGEIFVGRNYSSGEIFVTFQKIRHFRPTKFRPIRYITYSRMALILDLDHISAALIHGWRTWPKAMEYEVSLLLWLNPKIPLITIHIILWKRLTKNANIISREMLGDSEPRKRISPCLLAKISSFVRVPSSS